MKQMKYVFLLCSVLFLSFTVKSDQAENPWTEAQLMSVDVLAKKINSNQLKNTVILAIGFDATIKNSVDIGPGSQPENIQKLKTYLKSIKKNKEVVIYCGCCPFTRCPNIRPAFKAVQELGFKNTKLLNIETNIKTNWLDKGYPSNE